MVYELYLNRVIIFKIEFKEVETHKILKDPNQAFLKMKTTVYEMKNTSMGLMIDKKRGEKISELEGIAVNLPK